MGSIITFLPGFSWYMEDIASINTGLSWIIHLTDQTASREALIPANVLQRMLECLEDWDAITYMIRSIQRELLSRGD